MMYHRTRSVFYVALALLSACASARGKYVAESVALDGQAVAAPAPLLISAEEDSQFATEHIGLVDVTFENLGDRWVGIDNLRVDFGDPDVNSKVYIVEGQDLVAWGDAIQMKLAIEKHNRAMLVAGIGALGSTLTHTSSSQGGQAMGAALEATAAVAATTEVVSDRVAAVEKVALWPDNHVLFGGFRVPPKLYAKRFIVLNTDPDLQRALDEMYLTYDDDKGQTHRVRLPFRTRIKASIWGRQYRVKPESSSASRRPGRR